MQKAEFIEILKQLNIPLNEGIQNDKDVHTYPRIVFWDYTWEDVPASDNIYITNCTYQVSYFAREPRSKELIALKHLLNKKGIKLFIQHEYIEREKYFHSFFSVDLVEDI